MKAIFLILTVLGGFSADKMTGGWHDKDVNDEDIRKFATLAASKNSKMSNSLYFEKLVNITEAKSQVVAGIKYKITFEIAPTECKKSGKSHDNLSACPLLKCAPHQMCKTTIWTRAWMNDTQILSLKCDEGRNSC